MMGLPVLNMCVLLAATRTDYIICFFRIIEKLRGRLLPLWAGCWPRHRQTADDLEPDGFRGKLTALAGSS